MYTKTRDADLERDHDGLFRVFEKSFAGSTFFFLLKLVRSSHSAVKSVLFSVFAQFFDFKIFRKIVDKIKKELFEILFTVLQAFLVGTMITF